MRKISRRTVLRLTVAAALAALTGCGGGNDIPATKPDRTAAEELLAQLNEARNEKKAVPLVYDPEIAASMEDYAECTAEMAWWNEKYQEADDEEEKQQYLQKLGDATQKQYAALKVLKAKYYDDPETWSDEDFTLDEMDTSKRSARQFFLDKFNDKNDNGEFLKGTRAGVVSVKKSKRELYFLLIQ